MLNIKERYYERVLDIQGPNIENTLSSSGKWRNVESTEVATYWTIKGQMIYYMKRDKELIIPKDGSRIAVSSC